MRPRKYKVPLTVACYLLLGTAFLAIWIPVIEHYSIRNVIIIDEVLKKTREFPSDPMLEQLVSMHLGFSKPQRGKRSDLVLIAEKLLDGDVEMLGYFTNKITMPFAPEDLDKGLPIWRLALASLIVPRALLDAYEVSGREEFFTAATDVILAWARYEEALWLPRGMVWTDGAIAERVFVLARFWYVYRKHDDFKPGVAKSILKFIARSGQFLAKPTHFTFNTNHGVMQNLALFHLALAFPSLPGVDEYKQLAVRRLSDQMGFYINDEGVVLEHSPGYQWMGVELISMAMRYLTLLEMPIPDDWITKLDRAESVYAHYRRPDGSLPKVGDTDKPGWAYAGDEELSLRMNLQPAEAFSLWPTAGYAVWWNGLDAWPDPRELTQTVVAWSYFPGHAHKHADEMSVLLWAGGQTWWTNVGLWKYGVPGRSESVSWDGSNAPHLVNESPHSVRSTRLVNYGWTNNLAVIDLERRGPHEFVARRQVLYLKPNVWVVVDQVSSNDKSRTTWTTSHNVDLTKGRIGKEHYCLKAASNTSSLSTFVFGSPGNSVNTYRGNWKPFAGWEAFAHVNKPASAIVVERVPGESWSVVVWERHNNLGLCSQFEQAPRMTHWSNAEDWMIDLPIKSGRIAIGRNADQVFLRHDIANAKVDVLSLRKPPDVTSGITQIHDSYINAADKYPRFISFLRQRLKMTWLLSFLFVAQEMFLIVYRRVDGKYYKRMRIGVILAWAGGIVVLAMYFNQLVGILALLN